MIRKLWSFDPPLATAASMPISGGRTANLLIGQDFNLDADLAMRLGHLLGEDQVELSAPPKLALVG